MWSCKRTKTLMEACSKVCWSCKRPERLLGDRAQDRGISRFEPQRTGECDQSIVRLDKVARKLDGTDRSSAKVERELDGTKGCAQRHPSARGRNPGTTVHPGGVGVLRAFELRGEIQLVGMGGIGLPSGAPEALCCCVGHDGSEVRSLPALATQLRDGDN